MANIKLIFLQLGFYLILAQLTQCSARGKHFFPVIV